MPLWIWRAILWIIQVYCPSNLSEMFFPKWWWFLCVRACMRAHAGVFESVCVLVCAIVCYRVLSCAGVCWCVLVCVFVCVCLCMCTVYICVCLCVLVMCVVATGRPNNRNESMLIPIQMYINGLFIRTDCMMCNQVKLRARHVWLYFLFKDYIFNVKTSSTYFD